MHWVLVVFSTWYIRTVMNIPDLSAVSHGHNLEKLDLPTNLR
jgi:hypothetical protein